MSAKSLVRPSQKPVVPLPPEIHLTILKVALELPCDFDMELFRLPMPRKFAEKTLRARLVSSRHFLRVCRRWHDFVMPLFYETVWVSKMSQIEPLVCRVQTQRECYIGSDQVTLASSTSLPLIASYIKRLVFTPTMKQNVDDHHPIPRLASHCSSTLIYLHILSIIPHRYTLPPGPEPGLAEEFMRDLSILRNLVVLNLSIIMPPPSEPAIWSALAAMDKLEVLRFDDMNWVYDEFAQLVRDTKIRKFSFALPYTYYPPKELCMQNLNEICILGMHSPPENFPIFPANVERLTLQVESSQECLGLIFDGWLSSHFPHIRHLDLSVESWGDFGDASVALRNALPAGLTHIRLLAIKKVQGSVLDYLGFEDFCDAIATWAPQIDTVQILSRQTCIDLVRRHPVELQAIISALRASQTSLLNSEGKAF